MANRMVWRMASRPRQLASPEPMDSFREDFDALFAATFQKLFRIMQRFSGDPELASDVVQGAFVRLYRRGYLPDHPEAWLISVAMNLFRNERSTENRRLRLLAPMAVSEPMTPPPSLEEASAARATRHRVRATLDQLGDRDRMLLTLRAEGYGYRDLALALDLKEASVGTLLARARRAFIAAYGE